MPSNLLAFDRIRALSQRHRLFQAERVYQDQTQLDRMAAGGQFYDPGQSQTLILDQTNLQLARLDRYKDYEQMDQMGEISLALDLYADESSTLDSERKHTVIIRAHSRRLKKELEEFLYGTLLWDNYCRPSVRYLCKYGCFPAEIVPDKHRSGVSSLRFMNIYNFTRIETAYGDLVGFFYQDELRQQPIFMHPWQVMHLRLTSFENSHHPYGKCINLRSGILTPTGYKELGHLSRGDVVYSFNGHHPVSTTVLNTAVSGYKAGVRIRTQHRDIEVSEDHPILAILHGHQGRPFRRYVPAKHVVPGSIVVCSDPEYDPDSYMGEEVVGVRELGKLEVGDIQVDSGYSNFNANGMIVHNSVLDGGRKKFKQLRLMEDAALVYRICLRGDSLVWTPTGHTPIRDLKIGDEVYCFKDGAPAITTVTDWRCNGRDVIYRIFSQHREIYANATHPILVEVSYANKRKHDSPARLEYVDVKDLIAKRNGIAAHHHFVLPEITSTDYIQLNRSALGNHRKTKHGVAVAARPLVLPEVATEVFASWFGFMIGDGFISRRPHRDRPGSITSEVGFAAGDDAYINDKYAKIFADLVGHVRLMGNDGKRLGRYSINSRSFYDFMSDNGFLPGAENKRIPAWVFQSPRSVQEAFIDGYVDADGHRRMFKSGKTESCEVDCCNEMLLKDLKELCHRLGWDVGLVRKHDRQGGHEIEPGRMMPNTTAWALYFTKNQRSRPDFMVRTGQRSSNYSEAILGIEEFGEDFVYDITVADDCHNFLINGCACANTRAPEKRKFTIPVGLIPPKEVPEYMQMIARTFKRQRFYNTATGNFDERYSPLIQEDDFYLPRRPDGTGPDIETLPGAENLDQIKDIEYFKKGMIAPMKIPFARVGIGEGAGEGGGKPLSQESADFAKAVQWVQREVVTGLTKVCIVHLALRGYRIDDIKGFELAMSATNAMEELYRMETWQTRVGVMAELKELGWFPKEWIITHFTDLTPDEIQELKEIEAIEARGGDGDDEEGGGGGGGAMGAGGGGLDELPPIDGGEDGGGDDTSGSGPAPGPGGPTGLDLGEGDEPASEGYDLAAQRRVLREVRELRKRENKAELRQYLVRLAGRLGKDQFRDERKPANGYDQLLESKELDALSRSPVSGGGASDSELMVEWSIPKAIREAVIEEVRLVLTAEDGTEYPSDDEVVQEDFPLIRQVSDL